MVRTGDPSHRRTDKDTGQNLRLKTKYVCFGTGSQKIFVSVLSVCVAPVRGYTRGWDPRCVVTGDGVSSVDGSRRLRNRRHGGPSGKTGHDPRVRAGSVEGREGQCEYRTGPGLRATDPLSRFVTSAETADANLRGPESGSGVGGRLSLDPVGNKDNKGT